MMLDNVWFFGSISLRTNIVNNNLTKRQNVAKFHVCCWGFV